MKMDIEKNESQPNTEQATQENNNESRKGFSKEEIMKEMKQQVALAGPLVSLLLCMSIIQMTGITFVGHLGELDLSGAAIASSFATMAGYTLLRGMGSALETFCGQAYGAKEYHLLGIHLQRGLVVLLVMSIPISFVFANAADILKFLRQNPEIANEAGKYSRFLIPGFFSTAIVECLIRFLQTQRKVIPLMISSAIAIVISVPVGWVLVFKSELRMTGAAMASSIYCWIIAFLLIAYILFSPSFNQTWTGFSKDSIHGIPKFLKLAVPATIMISLEVWALEIVVLLSGVLPDPKLETSVLSICFNLHIFTYMLPFALSGAISTRVSNELGAGRPQSARLAVYVSVLMVLAEGIAMATLIVSGRNVWGYLFSKEIRVVKYVKEMMPFLAISHFINAIQTVLSGTCRGCGWQKVGSYVNMGAYYLIGIPFAIVLAFVFHIGGKGLWIGITIAMFVQVTCLSIITLSTDWDKQAKKALDRVHNSMVERDANALS